jgi:predicted Zn-dependent peptidase
MKSHVIIAGLILGAAFAPLAPALAEKQSPPEGAAPRPFQLPKSETYTLKNGFTVTLVPYGAAPKANIRAVVRVGNLNDGDKPWLADLAGDLMQEGAAGRSAEAIAVEAASMGGGLNVGVGLDQTTFTLDVLGERAPDAATLLADILQRPDFPEAEFGKAMQGLLRNLSIAATQPQAIANDAYWRRIYPNHPYSDGALPPKEKVAALTLADAKAFYAENFGAARTHLYVVGRFDAKAVKKAIKTAFQGWASGPAPLVAPPGDPAAPSVALVDRPGAVQSTIRLGKRVPPLDGSLELEAADTILGGYFSSRITRNIREDKGYTYSPNSFVSAEYRAAYWTQNADITSEATGPAIAEIVKEIRGLQDAPPPAAELQAIKNYMSGVFVIGLASRAGLSQNLSFANLHELGADYLSTYVSKVSGLTAQGVQNAAREHLKIDDMTLVVVGDLKTVRGQITALPDFSEKLAQ